MESLGIQVCNLWMVHCLNRGFNLSTQIMLYCGSGSMAEYGNFSANFDGDGISTKPLAKLGRLTEKTIFSLIKPVIYCTLGADRFQVGIVAANIPNKHMKRSGPPTSCLGQGLTTSHRKNSCY